MRARVGAATHVGLVRDHNEDGYAVEPPLYAVADGMGGHLGGEVASAIALDTLVRTWRDGSLADALRTANDAVYGRAIRDISVAGMGTTLTAVVLDGDRVLLAHVGDSRAYLLRDDSLRAITHDHSLVGEMMRAGELSEAEARAHPQRNIMTRAVGIDPNVDVDEDAFPAHGGDRLLLCSDGLCGVVTDDAIHETLGAHEDPQEAADALVDLANAAGGFDNITAVVIDLEEGEPVPAEAGAEEPEAEEPEDVEPEDVEPEDVELSAPAPEGTPEAESRRSRGFFGRLFGRS